MEAELIKQGDLFLEFVEKALFYFVQIAAGLLVSVLFSLLLTYLPSLLCVFGTILGLAGICTSLYLGYRLGTPLHQGVIVYILTILVFFLLIG